MSWKEQKGGNQKVEVISLPAATPKLGSFKTVLEIESGRVPEAWRLAVGAKARCLAFIGAPGPYFDFLHGPLHPRVTNQRGWECHWSLIRVFCSGAPSYERVQTGTVAH